MSTILRFDPRSRQSRLLVLGDLMLDRYTVGTVERVSPEAPVPVLRASGSDVRLGGATNVAAMCRALGAHVTVAGVVGNDHDGRTIGRLLREQSIDDQCLTIDDERITTVKQRFLGGADHRQSQQVLRVDSESTSPLGADVQLALSTRIASVISDCDVVLISDYGKGVCTQPLLGEVLRAAAGQGICVLVDPARNANYRDYEGAFLIKPNRSEAAGASGRPIDSVTDAALAARRIQESHSFSAVVITLDRDGVLLIEAGSEPRHFPAVHRDVCDITGAGDTALAMLGVTLSHGLRLDECVRLANAASGLQVQRIGTAPVTWEEVEAALTCADSAGKLVTLAELVQRTATYQRQGRRVVFTNGCFDLLHVGHVSYLQQAAVLGDVLIVAINSDSSVRRLKGESRPIIDQDSRAAMLAALSCIDHVVVFEEDTPCPLLERLRPDVLVKGGTYSRDEVVGREIVEAYGGRVHVVGKVDCVSTSQILTSIASRLPPVAGSSPLIVEDAATRFGLNNKTETRPNQ